MNKILIFFAAGCIGAFANSLTVWIFGQLGISALFGVSIAPPLSPAWLYPRIVWGGLWGLVFLAPILKSNWITKGVILSFLPTLVQIFIVFPLQAHKGLGGLELGMLTPALVLFFNAIWGVVTAFVIEFATTRS